MIFFFFTKLAALMEPDVTVLLYFSFTIKSLQTDDFVSVRLIQQNNGCSFVSVISSIGSSSKPVITYYHYFYTKH